MKLMIVDDHALVRRGMAHVVRECFPDAEVVEAGGSDEAVVLMEQGGVEVALVDVRMPGIDGLELLRTLKEGWKDVPVIMLSTYDQAVYVKRALADGAAGYLLKDATPDDLGQAIRVALSGSGNVLSPKVIQNLFEDVEANEKPHDGPGRQDYNLTSRERDILGLLSEGRSNRDIAQNLYLSEKTVKAHLAAVFRKLGVTNRTQAAMAAVSMGIGPPGQEKEEDNGDDRPRPTAQRR
ncbi:MAG: response regulator transcription factor [Actinomycetota bacterium]